MELHAWVTRLMAELGLEGEIDEGLVLDVADPEQPRSALGLLVQALAVRRRAGRFPATITLRGRPRGIAVLRIRARTKAGRVLSGVRTYHTCTEDPLMGLPPL